MKMYQQKRPSFSSSFSTNNSEISVFPKNWSKLTQQEQLEWINTYFMLKQRIPERILKKNDFILRGKLQTKSGSVLTFPDQPLLATQKNPNIVREKEFWLENWLITIFHDKKCPVVKFFSISNPRSGKWIAKELSFEFWSKLFQNILRIGNIYGFCGKKRSKFLRKKHDFALRHKINSRIKVKMEVIDNAVPE
jgi:hypothetical protein